MNTEFFDSNTLPPQAIAIVSPSVGNYRDIWTTLAKKELQIKKDHEPKPRARTRRLQCQERKRNSPLHLGSLTNRTLASRRRNPYSTSLPDAAKQAKKHSMRNSFHLCLADAHHSFSAFPPTQPPCCSFCDTTQFMNH